MSGPTVPEITTPPGPNKKSKHHAWSALVLLALLGVSCSGPWALGGEGKSQTTLYALTLSKSGGGVIKLAECRGKVLLIDVFTTWNQTSIVAIPRYSVLHGKYAKDGLALVGLAMDELGDKVVEPFLAGMETPYPVALANEQIREGRSLFGDLATIPSLMVFDRSGLLVHVFYGLIPAEQLESLVKRLL